MLLCDDLVRVHAFRSSPERLGVPRGFEALPPTAMTLDAAASLGRDVRGSVRHVLGDDVISAACHVLLSKPSSVRDCVSALRVPWPSAWVEWREAARIETRRNLGINHENGRDEPGRFGFLVQADPEGRCGSVRFAWSHPDEGMRLDVPSVCPLSLRFDLDRIGMPGAADSVGPAERLKSELYRKWQNHPVETAAINDVNYACWHEGIREAKMLSAALAVISGGGTARASQILDGFLDDVAGEGLQFLVVAMLLTARNGVETVPGEDRVKINKARAKRGESPLLEHVTVRMRLGRGHGNSESHQRSGTDGKRSSPRLHAVSGHFVRRWGSIFWRRAHPRGMGSGKSAAIRTVMVSL